MVVEMEEALGPLYVGISVLYCMYCEDSQCVPGGFEHSLSSHIVVFTFVLWFNCCFSSWGFVKLCFWLFSFSYLLRRKLASLVYSVLKCYVKWKNYDRCKTCVIVQMRSWTLDTPGKMSGEWMRTIM